MLTVRSPAGPRAARQQSAGGGPVVERIACWSARHRKAVVGGWLLFLGLAFLAGQVLGTQSRPSTIPARPGRASRSCTSLGVVTPPAESVLIQARGPGGRGRRVPRSPATRRCGRRRGRW